MTLTQDMHRRNISQGYNYLLSHAGIAVWNTLGKLALV